MILKDFEIDFTRIREYLTLLEGIDSHRKDFFLSEDKKRIEDQTLMLGLDGLTEVINLEKTLYRAYLNDKYQE